MSGQVYQLRAYISGIEVPVVNVQVSSAKDSVWAATLTMPWSPFLTKLPKGVKVTVFRRNTDLFDIKEYSNFRLMCDGVLVGITEVKAWQGQAMIVLKIQADASIYQWRKRIVTPLELAMSSQHMNLQWTNQAEVQTTIGGLDGIVPQAYSHLSKSEDKNATKAVAIFLTSTPNKSKADGVHGNANCSYVGMTEGKEAPIKAPNYGHLSPFMKRYFVTYKQSARVMFVDVPDVWKQALHSKEQWEMLTRQVETVQGMVTYWDCARYIMQQIQGDILMIPDATLVDPAVKTKDSTKFISKSPWNAGGDHKSLGELVLMPRNVFGKLPYCNIIFPDQIQRKMYKINHGAESTRVFMTGDKLPMNTPNMNNGLWAYRSTGPKGLTKYFESMNLTKNTPAGARSPYEDHTGVTPLICPIPEHLARVMDPRTDDTDEHQTKPPDPKLMETLNYEFMIGYSQKFSLQLSVTPDVEVVPGAPILIIDEDGEHLIAYCSGVTYSWDANGQVGTSLQLSYPHHYSWDMEGAIHYGNPFSHTDDANDPIIERYAAIVGSEICKDSHIKLAEDYFKKWKMEYNRDSRRVKYDNKRTKIIRDVCTMKEYVEFMGGNWDEVKSQPIFDEKGLTTLGVTLIKKLDTEDEAAKLSSAVYRWFDPLKQEAIDSVKDKPDYTKIGKPGAIVPYQYASGIVDAHIKYLYQIGHFVSV